MLIDEGQDFPDGFYELCFHLAKGTRDEKQIIWAYDELQNIFDIKVRKPTQLFGTDKDGEPRVDLKRSRAPYAQTNDFVLPKCYRNQRNVLVLAHAIGFGIYGNLVQMLEDKEHWEDVGYEIVKGTMKRGELVEVTRPEQNSPTQLVSPRGTPLVHWQGFNTLDEEVAYCASVFQEFIDGGLQPHDLMAIAVDDRAARTYLSELSEELANRGIPSNNIIADRYSEPSFLIEGKCTLTTVHRAKGNESAVVVVLGNDAVPLESRSGRNRLFTAFTRTKGWLRVTGMGNGFAPLRREIERAMSLAPSMSFIMEDPARIEMIQRDLSERDARILRAQAEMERLKDELGVTDEELAEELNKKNKSRKDAKK